MTKQIPLIILGSARGDGDTRTFIDYVFENTEYKFIDLLDYTISNYNYTGKYSSSDNFNELTDDILNHGTVIFATPVYWYSMSTQMKNLFDRLTDLVTIQKATGRKLKGKNIFLLSVGTDEELPEGFETPFKGTAEYLDMCYGGSIYFSTGRAMPDTVKRSRSDMFINSIKETLK